MPGRDDWWVRALVAFLAVDDAAWSHHTAAFVQGLVSRPPEKLDLLVGHERRLHAPSDVILQRRRDVNRFVDELHWPWRTTVEETILDVSAASTMDETFALLGRAFQRRLTREAALWSRLLARDRHPQRRLLDMVLADVAERRARWRSATSWTSNERTAFRLGGASSPRGRVTVPSTTSGMSTNAFSPSWTAGPVMKNATPASETGSAIGGAPQPGG